MESQVAQLTAEEQAKVTALVARSKVLYEAILKANPGNELGIALRDKVPFDKLKDESIAQVATAVALFAKGLAKLDEDAKAASEQPKTEPGKATEIVPETTPAPKADGKKK